MPGLATIFSWLGGGILEGIFKTFVQPFLQAYLKSKDVDLEKFKQSTTSTTELAAAVLSANVRYAEIKSGFIVSILQWWPIRMCFVLLIATSTARFMLACFDSTWWWMFGCMIDGRHVIGDACSWSFPSMKGAFAEAEKQFLLIFVIAKPVDSVVTNAANAVSRYIRR
jgi:hypothetical protein